MKIEGYFFIILLCLFLFWFYYFYINEKNQEIKEEEQVEPFLNFVSQSIPIFYENNELLKSKILSENKDTIFEEQIPTICYEFIILPLQNNLYIFKSITNNVGRRIGFIYYGNLEFKKISDRLKDFEWNVEWNEINEQTESFETLENLKEKEKQIQSKIIKNREKIIWDVNEKMYKLKKENDELKENDNNKEKEIVYWFEKKEGKKMRVYRNYPLLESIYTEYLPFSKSWKIEQKKDEIGETKMGLNSYILSLLSENQILLSPSIDLKNIDKTNLNFPFKWYISKEIFHNYPILPLLCLSSYSILEKI